GSPLPPGKSLLAFLTAQFGQLRGKDINGTFSFGQMPTITPVSQVISYGVGNVISFSFVWDIKDFIREHILGEQICDCRVGLTVKLQIQASNRNLVITVEPIGASDAGLGAPSNCPALGVATLVVAIANYINPIIFAPAIQLANIELQPALDTALAAAFQ